MPNQLLEQVAIPLHLVEPPELPPVEDLEMPVCKASTEPHPTIPFDNLAFEGGGAKGMAYLGALQVLEEVGVYPNHVRRIAGTSSGSFFAAMLAVGVRSDQLTELLFETDLVTILKDARFGRISAAWNLFTTYGFHPGFKLLRFLGDRLEERTGSPDVTFRQVLDRCGRELCVPITNITRMCAEYCHPKTTPDMPVRLAVAMSMSLPVLMRPYRLVRRVDEELEETDLYTDGGILCNFPLHVFDGWWLSMKPEDCFVKQLGPEPEAFAHPMEPFRPRNPRTLGFSVFDVDERDSTAGWLPEGGGPPERPDTLLARLRGHVEETGRHKTKQARALDASFSRLLAALQKVESDGDGRINAEEASRLFDEGPLSKKDAKALFGTADPDEIFRALDHDGNGLIDPDELVHFMDARNIRITAHALGARRAETGSIGAFMTNVMQTMLFHIRKLNLNESDHDRTIPIDTDYVGTAHFALQEDDRRFLLETGRRATRAFLSRYGV